MVCDIANNENQDENERNCQKKIENQHEIKQPTIFRDAETSLNKLIKNHN